ncbi:MAG: VWA domain-containing protein [Opitutaceae bacterium]
MKIDSPEWLILIPLFLILGWYVRDLRLWEPRRIICLLLLVVALVNPHWQVYKPGVDLVLLVDQSESAKTLVQPRVNEFVEILEASMSADDQLRIVDFAEATVQRGAGETAEYSAGRGLTRTDAALRYAMAMQDSERATRFLLLSDGYSTSPLTDMSEALRSEAISLFYRKMEMETFRDVRIAQFEMPERTQLGAPFMVEFQVTGAGQESANYQLLRNDEIVGEGSVAIEDNQGWVRLTDRLSQPGAFKYTVRIDAAGDSQAGNNVAERWIEIEAGGRVLLISAYSDDPLVKILSAQGFKVQLVNDYGSLTEGALAGAKVVLINNVPANVIPDDFLKELHTYVTVQGGGFAMFGGKYSFGSGGYYQSPVDQVLPISMELREDQKRLATAMVIVMDRSGSMGASVEGGRTKMDLANAGAAGTVDLLGPMDSIAVFAVDSQAHEILPMTMIGKRKELLRNEILHIESRGGGIFVYTGLQAAWDQLKHVSVGQRHIILFSDAADSEEPGEFRALLAEMQSEGATISVIGLGSESDSDADFLKEIAALGGGRIFFNSNPEDLPRVFAQETVAVARSSFVEQMTAVKGTDGWMQLASQPMDWLPEVEGYNLSYLKPDAILGAQTQDEYQAPLLAFQRFGAGRSVALTFALGGEYSSNTRNWEGFPNMIQTIVRWLGGENVPEGIGLQVDIDGSQLNLDFLYDAKHEQLIANHPPQILITNDQTEAVEVMAWRRVKPGHLSVDKELEFGRVYKGAVQLGEMVLPFGPLMTTESIEWEQDRKRVFELEQLAKNSGGRDLVQLEDIWKGTLSMRYVSLRFWIVLVLLLFSLAEFLMTRIRQS